METLRGNAVVAQSGGPTAVINASACGVIQKAQRHRDRDAIRHIFGANNGILGIIHEDLFDLGAESADTIEGLRCTPASAIGSCRFKLGDLERYAFGHRQLGGVADYLRQLVTKEIGLKARYNKLDTCQRNAVHFASRADSDEAYRCGQDAVRHGLDGTTGKMVSLVRLSDAPYRRETGLVPLAARVRPLPASADPEEVGCVCRDQMRNEIRNPNLEIRNRFESLKSERIARAW